MRKLHPLTRQLGIALLLFLPAPIFVVVGASFTSAGHIQFPPGELSIRWYIEAVLDPSWPTAFFTSLWIAAATAVVITAISFLTAFYCIRYAPGIAGILETMIFSPLFFPHAALGVAMVAVVASLGLLGTGTGIVLAHLICTLPFAYRPMFISLKKIDGELIEAAQVLGASEWRIMRDVILPLSKSGFVTALLFSFIISFDEVTVSMFLIGPDVITLPVQIYSFIQDSASPVLAAISTATVVITFLIVFLLERTVGLEFFVEKDFA